MIRRLLNVVAVLSLLVAVGLAVGSLAYTPGQVREVSVGGWVAQSLNGTFSLSHRLRFIGSVDMSQLTVPFAGVPLASACIDCWRERRRQRAKGFPVEPVQK